MFGYCSWVLISRLNKYHNIIYNTNSTVNRHTIPNLEKYNINSVNPFYYYKLPFKNYDEYPFKLHKK